MSLFGGRAEHAANPPDTWNVVRSGNRWNLITTAGAVLDSFDRKRDAEAGRITGFAADLYAKETRWYAGETIPGWKPYQPPPTAAEAADMTGTTTTSGVREWRVPFEPRMINDADPGHEGPSCEPCATYQRDRQARADGSPMLTSPYGGKPYRSPHAGTYLFHARYSRFQCTQGVHGPVRGA